MKKHDYILWSISFLSFAVIAAVCWHSVEEIHYLKTFYPEIFTVEQAYLAAKVEILKIAFISFPFLYLTATAFLLLRKKK